MGMFDNYENITNNIPSNGCCNQHIGCNSNKVDKPNTSISTNKPFESYDKNGNVIGYWWYEGDTLNLEFDIDGEVIVEEEVIDSVEGEEVTKIESIYIPAEEFLKDKKILFNFYNFRGESIISKTYDAATTIVFEIDENVTKLLKKGTYSCSLVLYDDKSFNKKIYSQEDCVFTIK